jgi:hydrogenase expression/formation protein HypE
MNPSPDQRIELGHGGGGRLSRDFVESQILSRFGNECLAPLPDAARLPAQDADLLFTTDSFVVQPFEFPGGNIGELAVYGTVNDISVSGGRPLWLSLALIVEEGLPFATLGRILDSARDAATACGVRIVTGDTKVVPRGQCDGLYVNTAGIGRAIPGYNLSASSLREGDRIIVSGTIGEHGAAVLCARKNISIANGPVSDAAPVHRLVEAAAPWSDGIRFMRDPTRGGLAAVLNEAAAQAPRGVVLHEGALPVSPQVRAVAEMLGLDVLHVPSEGRIVAVVAPEATEAVLRAWRGTACGRGAVEVGEVAGKPGRVIMETLAGGRRLVDLPRGELLPRIC